MKDSIFSSAKSSYYCEQVDVAQLAKTVGTPFYLYSKRAIEERSQGLIRAFKNYPTVICYAVKANSNLSVLRLIFKNGLGADIVSIGELTRARRADVRPDKVVFSGVGKQTDEIEAGLSAGILSFNVESVAELKDIDAVARSMDKVANLSLRINPNIKVDTNPHIATGLYSTKFGIAEGDLAEALSEIKKRKHLRLIGMGCHIGSQILDLESFEEAATRMVTVSKQVKEQGFGLELLNLGGGMGVQYQSDETPPEFSAYAKTLIDRVTPTGLKLVIEPGRSVVANAGVLVTKVLNIKRTPEKNFIIIDGAMNDLIRPSLYDAYHGIETVTPGKPSMLADVVGPVCESGDFLGKDRNLPEVKTGEYLVVKSCGAYGFSMASNYNSRPRPPEILVDGEKWETVRKRETMESQWALE